MSAAGGISTELGELLCIIVSCASGPTFPNQPGGSVISLQARTFDPNKRRLRSDLADCNSHIHVRLTSTHSRGHSQPPQPNPPTRPTQPPPRPLPRRRMGSRLPRRSPRSCSSATPISPSSTRTRSPFGPPTTGPPRSSSRARRARARPPPAGSVPAQAAMPRARSTSSSALSTGLSSTGSRRQWRRRWGREKVSGRGRRGPS